MLQKDPVKIRTANLRQVIYYTIWGFIGGIYILPPLLSAGQKEGKSFLAEYIEEKEKREKEVREKEGLKFENGQPSTEKTQ